MVLDINEKEAGCHLGQPLIHLVGEVTLNEGDGHKYG